MPCNPRESDSCTAQGPTAVEGGVSLPWLWSPGIGYLAVLAASCCWGLSWTAIKVLMVRISPLALNWLQMVPALFFALGMHLVASRRAREARYPINWLIIFGLTACVVFYTRNLGCQLTSPTTGSIISSLDVFFTALLSLWVLRVPLTTFSVAGGLLLLGGAALVMNVFSGVVVFSPLGYLVLILSALSTAVNALIIKLHFQHTTDATVVLASAVVQCTVFAPLLWATDQWHYVLEAARDPHLCLGVVGVSILITVGLYLYYFAMKRAPMTNVRMLYLSSSGFAMITDYLWLGAAISASQIAGLLAVMLGAALVIHGTPQQPDSSPGLVR
ncbi:MAG: DMT family transporter [Armatimonadota bacterium]